MNVVQMFLFSTAILRMHVTFSNTRNYVIWMVYYLYRAHFVYILCGWIRFTIYSHILLENNQHSLFIIASNPLYHGIKYDMREKLIEVMKRERTENVYKCDIAIPKPLMHRHIQLIDFSLIILSVAFLSLCLCCDIFGFSGFTTIYWTLRLWENFTMATHWF